MPDVPADPRVLTLHLEIQRMRAELESFEQRLEQIRLSEAAAAADTRPFAERAEELVSQMVASLHQTGMDEISAVTTEARMVAGTRLEDANRQAQRILDAAREELAAALTEHAVVSQPLEDDGSVIVLDEDVLILPDDDVAAPVPDVMPVPTVTDTFAGDDLASALDDLPVVSDPEVAVLPEADLAAVLAALGSFAAGERAVAEPEPDVLPTTDELVGAHEEPVAPEADGLVTLPHDDVVVSDVVDVIPLAGGDLVTPAFDEVDLAPPDEVIAPEPEPESDVVSLKDAFVAPTPFVVPPPVVGPSTYAPPTYAPPTYGPPTGEPSATEPSPVLPFASAAAVPLDQVVTAPPATVAEPVAAPDEGVAPAAEAEAPVQEPVGALAQESAALPSSSALDQATRRESIAVQEPSALGTADPAPSGAAFDIWLAMAPSVEGETEDARRSAERSRPRWVRPVEVIAGLLLVVALVVVLLIVFA